ncbi:MAG: TIGR02281 family clan AA aspartic protease [Planctomycetota bacterium]
MRSAILLNPTSRWNLDTFKTSLEKWVIGCFIVLMFETCSAQESSKTGQANPLGQEIAEVLTERDLTLVGPNLILGLDTQITKEVRALKDKKKALAEADKKRLAALADIELSKRMMTELRTKHRILSTQLAGVLDVATNNRLVGELNATAGAMAQLEEDKPERLKRAKSEKDAVGREEEAFVQVLGKIREKVDSAFETWEGLKNDQKLIEAIDAASKKIGKKISIQPSTTLVTSEKQLKTYEQAMISESIPLEKESGVYSVKVSINGKPGEQMIVDSAASSISLGHEFAKKLGIEIKDSDDDAIVTLADGSQIPAKIVYLDSVRVGKFTAENVECCVMHPRAVNAPALLGMSFLDQFKFEIDSEKMELKMLKVDSGEKKVSPSKSKKPVK